LLFADWLIDPLARGGDITPTDEAWAELIQLQCRLAALADNDPDLAGLVQREQTWLARHKTDVVRAECSGLIPANTATFQRGMLHLHITQEQWHPWIEGLPDWTPITSASIRSIDNIELLADSAALARLTSLDLSGNNIGYAGVTALAASPHLACLTRINLSDNWIGNAGAMALAASSQLGRLTSLNLQGNWIGAGGAAALAASQHLAGLTDLNLSSNYIGDPGARRLAASSRLVSLINLNLWINGIGDDGRQALLDASQNQESGSSLYGMVWDDNNVGTRSVEVARQVAARLAASSQGQDATPPDPANPPPPNPPRRGGRGGGGGRGGQG